MRLKNIAALAIAVAAMSTVTTSPAVARPHRDHYRDHHRVKVCKTEWRHHRRVRVCHWR